VPDGVSVVWASHIIGDSLPERIAGVDFMEGLLRAANEHELSVYFLGAKQEVLDTLIQRCARELPRMIVAGSQHGYFGEGEHPRVVQQVKASGADLLFIGMPTPFKETWAQRYRDELGVPVVMGVGGSFDVLAGYIERAPRWLQRAGMEWSWRLAKEPSKMWKRYLLTNTEFLWLTATATVARRVARIQPSSRES
jgi:N-acetylglucosaminyldiphosphoundecaprenol N-acetyl-beta-D-mannosaminyltransferase